MSLMHDLLVRTAREMEQRVESVLDKAETCKLDGLRDHLINNAILFEQELKEFKIKHRIT